MLLFEGKELVWTEFQVIYGEKINYKKLYDFRKFVLPILDEHKINDFLILSEPTCVLLRVEINEQNRENIRKILTAMVETSEDGFSDVKVGEWNPEKDARDRILKVAKDLRIVLNEGKGWMVAGREPLNNHWVVTEDDLELKVTEFSRFMTRVVGRFTRAYFENMPRIAQDRWLFSVLLHLLLNSVAFDQKQERETRDFPYF
jgi:hypothetical protein